MDDPANPTDPQPSWSFDDSSTRQGDTSAEATTRAPTNPTIPPETWSFDDVLRHHKDTSPEASSLPPQTASDSGADATKTAPAEADQADSPHEYAEAADTPPEAAPEQPDPRKYQVRTCRICLEDVSPTFEPVSTSTQFLGQRPRVLYVSDDPDTGRLMRPCKCKGTQQYVHEGCLKAWRMSTADHRTLWQCPTCLYEYRLNRLSWGAWINSKIFRVVLTAAILLVAVFVLGFIADPIFRYADPIGMISGYAFDMFDEFEDADVDEWLPDEPNSWYSHFTKGFFALGVVGMAKTIFIARPWHIARVGGGARRRGGGRDRLGDASLLLVIMGVATFLMVNCTSVNIITVLASTDLS